MRAGVLFDKWMCKRDGRRMYDESRANCFFGIYRVFPFS